MTDLIGRWAGRAAREGEEVKNTDSTPSERQQCCNYHTSGGNHHDCNTIPLSKWEQQGSDLKLSTRPSERAMELAREIVNAEASRDLEDTIATIIDRSLKLEREEQLERDAREVCPICKMSFEHPEGYLVGPVRLEGRHWVHPWLDGRKGEGAVCFAADLRNQHAGCLCRLSCRW